MLPSASILNTLNTQIGTQHIQYKNFFKGIFVQVATALTALGNANGAAILALVNGLSNDQEAWQTDVKAMFIDAGNGLVALGQTTAGNTILNYFKQNPTQNLVWGDQVQSLIVTIQKALAALGK